MTSRSTSTWRVRPWQACTWTLRSVSASGGGSVRHDVVGEVLLEPAEQGVGERPDSCSTVWLPGAVRAMSCCSSSTSRDSDVSSGLASRLRAVSSLRRTTGGTAATVSHNAGDEWCSHRCTSRCSARAASTCSRAGESRLAPNTDSRAGRSLSDGSSRSRAQASSSSSAGLGVPRVSRSRRHSSACQARSASSGLPSPRSSRPAAQARSISGRDCPYSSYIEVRRRATESRRPLSSASVPRCCASDRAHGSDGIDASMTSSSGHTDRPGAHRCDSRRRARPTTRPAPRRPACSATGRRRSRRRRRPPTYRGRATAAGRSSARLPWPAPRRPRPRTGRPAGRRARRPARGPAQPRGGPGG